MAKHLEFSFGRKSIVKPPTVSSSGKSTVTSASSDKVCTDLANTVVLIASEPSLAYFRIQEHIRKVTPELAEDRANAQTLHSQLMGASFDLDYAISTVRSSARASVHLLRINELLKSSLFTLTQLDCAKKFSLDVELGVDLVSTLVPEQPSPSQASPNLKSTTYRPLRSVSAQASTASGTSSAGAHRKSLDSAGATFCEVRRRAPGLSGRLTGARNSADAACLIGGSYGCRSPVDIGIPADSAFTESDSGLVPRKCDNATSNVEDTSV